MVPKAILHEAPTNKAEPLATSKADTVKTNVPTKRKTALKASLTTASPVTKSLNGTKTNMWILKRSKPLIHKGCPPPTHIPTQQQEGVPIVSSRLWHTLLLLMENGRVLTKTVTYRLSVKVRKLAIPVSSNTLRTSSVAPTKKIAGFSPIIWSA